jgi:rubrerythrin
MKKPKEQVIYWIKDEKKAEKEYKNFPKRLGKKGKCAYAQALFNKISDDEKSHARALKKIEKVV